MSSSGVLPTSYGKSWEDQSHKGTYDDMATRLTGSYGLSIYRSNPSDVAMWFNRQKSVRLSRGIRLFYAGTPTWSGVRWNTSPISQYEDPEFSYTVTTDQEKIIDQTTRWNVNRTLQQRDFTTAYIWHHPYASRLDLLNASNSENHETFFVDSIISKFDTLYQYEDPPVDDIRYAEYFIKDFASYINHDIHHIDMLDMVKIDEDDYVSIKWKRDGRSLYFEIKDEYVYFTKLWFQDGRLISSDGTLTKEIYKETWKWIINGNL